MLEFDAAKNQMILKQGGKETVFRREKCRFSYSPSQVDDRRYVGLTTANIFVFEEQQKTKGISLSTFVLLKCGWTARTRT